MLFLKLRSIHTRLSLAPLCPNLGVAGWRKRTRGRLQPKCPQTNLFRHFIKLCAAIKCPVRLCLLPCFCQPVCLAVRPEWIIIRDPPPRAGLKWSIPVCCSSRDERPGLGLNELSFEGFIWYILNIKVLFLSRLLGTLQTDIKQREKASWPHQGITLGYQLLYPVFVSIAFLIFYWFFLLHLFRQINAY